MKSEQEAYQDAEVLNRYCRRCYDTAKSKGFHDGAFNFGEKIALVHSELSEALEAYRKHLASSHIPTRSGVEEELADTLIRIFDLCGAIGFDIGGTVEEKMRFNETREYKHGKAL